MRAFTLFLGVSFLVAMGLAWYSCGRSPDADPVPEEPVGLAAPVPDDPVADHASPYPVVMPVNSQMRARAKQLAAHARALDTKCVEILGNTFVVSRGDDGEPTAYGCPRPDGDPSSWGAN